MAKEKETKAEKVEVAVYLNGRIVGKHSDGDALVREIIALRRNGEINNEINVEYYRDLGEVYIN
ncbi:MAG: hypothetical protein QW112_02055, partial [Candidatus Micrarchaeia archaeon]